MRAAVLFGAAFLGLTVRVMAVWFSETRGGIKKYIPLIAPALKRGRPIAPL